MTSPTKTAHAAMPTEKELLAELNGGGVLKGNPKLSFPDGEQKTTLRDDPLELAPAKALTPLERVEKKHATSQGGSGYAVTVRGEYFAAGAESNAKVRKNYELVFNLPELADPKTKTPTALGIIVGRLLEPALRKLDVRYHGYRTHEIVGVVPLGNAPESNNLHFMKRERLEQYVRDNFVPVNPADYPDVVHLRAACVDFALNPKGFEKREADKQADRARDRQLAELNPGLELQTR